MANGFRAPSIVGQGRLSAPRDAGDPIGKYYERAESTKRWGSEYQEKQRQFNETILSKAIDQNIRMKWLKAQHRKDALTQHKDSGTKQPFNEWYQEKYPNVETEFSDATQKEAYERYQKTMKQASVDPNVAYAQIMNPFTGLGQDIQGGWDVGKELAGDVWQGTKNIASPIIGGISSLFGQQDGGYFPGNRNGDKNPAMVEDGEYVLNRNAVKKLGKSFLDRVNYEEAPRFQQGGFTGGMGPMPGQAQIQRPGLADLSGWYKKAEEEKEEEEVVEELTEGGEEGFSTEEGTFDSESDFLDKTGVSEEVDLQGSSFETAPTAPPVAPPVAGGFSGTQSGSSGFQSNPTIIDDPMGGKEAASNIMELIPSVLSAAGAAAGGGGMQKGGPVKGKKMFGYQSGGVTSGTEQERQGEKRGGLTPAEEKRLIESEGSMYYEPYRQDEKASEYREGWESDLFEGIKRQQDQYHDLESELDESYKNMYDRGSWLNTILAPFAGAGTAGKIGWTGLKALSPFFTGAGVRGSVAGNEPDKRASWKSGQYGTYDTMLGPMDEGRLNMLNEFNPMWPVMRYLGDKGLLEWAGMPSVKKEYSKRKADARRTSTPRFPSDKIHMDKRDLQLINQAQGMNLENLSDEDLMNLQNYLQPQSATQDSTRVK